jgi:YbbR domain-containing protein
MEQQEKNNTKNILSRLKRAATRNIWLKLISLFLAFVLWFGITGGPKSETTVTVRLDLTSAIPDGWAIADNYIREVEITLSGRSSLIQRLANSEEARAEISISPNPDVVQEVTDTQRIPLTPDDVFVRNVDVVRVHPTEILLRLDRRVRVSKQIMVNLINTLPEGFVLQGDSPIVRPPMVTVTGAKVLVDRISFVGATLDLAQLNVTGSEVVSTSVLLERDQLLQYSVRDVEVLLDIVEVSETRRLNITDFTFSGVDEATESVRVFGPQRFTVDVTGPRSWIDQLDADSVTLDVDLSEVERGSRVQVPVDLSMFRFSNPYSRSELVEIKFVSESKYILLSINPG